MRGPREPIADGRFLVNADQSLFASVGQIGYAVADLDESMAAFIRANRAPTKFDVFETVLDGIGNYRYHGRPDECKLRIATANFGAMDFELIQVLSGHHPARDFVESSGDGINHLGVYIDDLDHWRTYLLPKHAEVVIEGEFHISDSRKGQFAYVQLLGGGPLYELLQM